MRKIFLLLSVVTFHHSVYSQTGGGHIFPFINLSPSSRISGLGGMANAIMDEDVSLFVQNPALLNGSMNNRISLCYQPFFGGIYNNFAAYSHTFGKDWSAGGALQFINYGKFTGSNLNGDTLSTFFANDYALTAGVSRPLSAHINYGANIKFLYSVLSGYSSSGIALDFGGSYCDTSKGLTIGIVISNFGTQLKSYTEGNGEKLPVDIQAGFSKRLKHTPFLFSLGFHHLQQFDIRYNDTNAIQLNTVTVDTSNGNNKPKKYIADKIARHVVLGIEIHLGKNLRFEIGYNHLRRQELAFDSRKGLAGFSFGTQVRISRFNIGYGHTFFNTAGGYNAISLGLDLDDFFGKKKM